MQEVEVEEKSIITEKLDAFKNKIKKKKAAIRSKVYCTVYTVYTVHIHVSHAKLGTEGILSKVYCTHMYVMPT
jgi:hypothetical protein